MRLARWAYRGSFCRTPIATSSATSGTGVYEPIPSGPARSHITVSITAAQAGPEIQVTGTAPALIML
ncbi:hypothetical protein AQJ11_35580 [Streptomyces corchorusii]|uniref:Uncharacterized protein n=1 Tax=Streptomyces corchorusii TaxID=1903 RepID=A0A101PUN4_STRCK|nr:hypothetical protein AQJ11_35580 [Streptomyces corchorusii]